jgi:integrase
VQKLSWHDLRHTAISRWIANGADVVQVQRLAGHANPSITLRLYARDFDRAERQDSIREKLSLAEAK